MSLHYEQLIRRAFGRREALFGDAATDCFRLFNGGGDGAEGITIDLYGRYLLVQFFLGAAGREQGDLLKAVENSCVGLPVEVRGILFKDRRKRPAGRAGDAGYASEVAAGEGPPARYTVTQNGVRAVVNLMEGLGTGVFLDMREVRDRLRDAYVGGDLLNLFCYTALHSVHALKNGMDGAVNIDLSGPALRWARLNYEENGLTIDEKSFVRGDSLEWIRIFGKKKRRFGLVIFDPPTFSRNRKKSFSIKRDYASSLRHVSPIAAGGHVLTCVNTESISRDEYLSCHPAGWENLFLAHEPSDFPYRDRPYLKAGLWRVSD